MPRFYVPPSDVYWFGSAISHSILMMSDICGVWCRFEVLGNFLRNYLTRIHRSSTIFQCMLFICLAFDSPRNPNQMVRFVRKFEFLSFLFSPQDPMLPLGFIPWSTKHLSTIQKYSRLSWGSPRFPSFHPWVSFWDLVHDGDDDTTYRVQNLDFFRVPFFFRVPTHVHAFSALRLFLLRRRLWFRALSVNPIALRHPVFFPVALSDIALVAQEFGQAMVSWAAHTQEGRIRC